MARFLSQTLIRGSQSLVSDSYHHHHHHHHLLSGASPFPFSALSARLLNLRGRSDRPEGPRLIEVDLGASATAEGEDAGIDLEIITIRRLEDVIHGIVVRQMAPDWLPFVPGASYWVPPKRRAVNVMGLVGRLPAPMTEEEDLSHMSTRGWPSSAYYMEGSAGPANKSPKEPKAQSDDEE